MNGTRILRIRLVVALLSILCCLGCRPNEEAEQDRAGLPDSRAGRAPRPTDTDRMSPAGGESQPKGPGISPTETVARTESGEAPKLSVETLMEEQIAPGFRALTAAARDGRMDEVAKAARTLRSRLEPTPYSPGAPTERVRQDAFIGFSDDAVAAISKAERAATAKDTQALAEAVGEVEKSCAACHAEFRKKG